MSWNGNDNNKAPWGRKDGPPDIDEAIDQFKKKIGGIFGGSGGSGPGLSKKKYFFWIHTSCTYLDWYGYLSGRTSRTVSGLETG